MALTFEERLVTFAEHLDGKLDATKSMRRAITSGRTRAIVRIFELERPFKKFSEDGERTFLPIEDQHDDNQPYELYQGLVILNPEPTPNPFECSFFQFQMLDVEGNVLPERYELDLPLTMDEVLEVGFLFKGESSVCRGVHPTELVEAVEQLGCSLVSQHESPAPLLLKKEVATNLVWTPQKLAEAEAYRDAHGTTKTAKRYGVSPQRIRQLLPRKKPKPQGYSAFTHLSK